uniref:Transmembrane protein n=1 Tax=Neospora caninum (strain Liverpool) TaxID=572307 RepID=A0A0F7U8P8_NEOCL|nr:TPA: hypothetical protein BN1204_020920 [Neospora caninum Liverpool]
MRPDKKRGTCAASGSSASHVLASPRGETSRLFASARSTPHISSTPYVVSPLNRPASALCAGNPKPPRGPLSEHRGCLLFSLASVASLLSLAASALPYEPAPRGAPAGTVSASPRGEASVEDALEEKYTPRNCKYRPLPMTLNDFAYLSYNGEITLGDVFGLPASSILHEQRVSFSIASEAETSANSRRAILSVSVEMHRDNVAEFNHLELYRRRKSEKPHPALSASEAAAAADGAGAMQSAIRRQQAVAVGRRVEGAGGPRTKVVLSAALSDEDGDAVFDLVFSFRDSRGRTPLADGETIGHSPLLPCFPVRVDLSVVPVDRMPLHIPSNCPAESSLPKTAEVVTLGDAPLTLSNPPEAPFVFVFRNVSSWAPYSLPVWSTSVDVPRRLHRFARFFFRLSFRFVSGPLQLLLELFDEKSQPDPHATGPQCLLGCMGATPTYNGHLFDHAMPTGFLYKIWVLAGEPMFLEDHATQCMQFDLEYRVNYETRLTPFEVGHHSWMCKFARLPTAIHQIEEGERGENTAEAAADPVGAVYARSLDFKDWVGFPPDEVDEMMHFVDLHIKEPSDIAVSLYQANLRLRTALTSGNGDNLEEMCGEKVLGDKDSGMVALHCRVAPGTYHLALFAEYPLGGLPPCDGFYMRLTVKPLALLNQRYGCVNRASASTMQLPPLLISPSGPPPLSAPPPSEDVIDLGVVTEAREENFRTFVFRMTPPPVKANGAFKVVAQGRFTVEKSLSQVYVHLAVLSDFTAADLAGIIRREGGDEGESSATHALSFSHDYQHLVGPFDAGTYTVEIVALTPETLDFVAANSAQELCIPFVIDLRLVTRSGDDIHSGTWLCKNDTPHLPRYIRGEVDVEMTLDKEFLLPASGHQHLHLYIPRNSMLKVHVRSPHSSEPRISIFPKERPQDKLGEAYTDLFLETDVEGEYIVRIAFSLQSTSLPPCPTAQLHLVLVPKSAVPQCPWARGGGLSRDELKTRAEEHLRRTLDAGIFIPKQIAAHRLEVAAPRDFWLSPSVNPEFAFSSDSPATSVRVEVVLHPPWIPAQLLLFKRDSLGLRRKPEAVSLLTQNRLLLLATDVGSGDFVLRLKIYDEVDSPTERLCAHATIHAEIGDADETTVNALRAELLSLPDLMPVEPPLSSFNRRGWLSLPDVPVFSTSVFRFDEENPTTAVSSPAPRDLKRRPQFAARAEPEATGQDAIRLEKGASATLLTVEKPTLLRVASEPAVLSRDRLLMRVFCRKDAVAAAQTGETRQRAAVPGTVRKEEGKDDLVVGSVGGEDDDGLNFMLIEEADSNLLVLLNPGTYKFTYQAEGPFLITFGISSVDQLHRDLLFHPASPGGVRDSESPCLANPPALSLPSPLPFFFESETFDVKLQPSFVQKQGEIMNVPLHVTTPSVLYVESGSNFLLDFIKVGVRVAEGTWIGEQRGRVNFLRLILEPGTHYLKIYNTHANNVYKPEHEIKQSVDSQRCLHFSLKIRVVAVNYAGPEGDADAADSCFSFGAMSLPLDLHSSEGGSAALGGPIDANGRLLIRSKIVLTDANGEGKKRVALDTKGKDLVLKLGVFSEDHDRSVVVQVEDAHSLPVAAVHDWTISDGGYEKLFELDGSKRKYNALDQSSTFYLTFRLDRAAVAGAAPCVVFDLIIQVMPMEDKHKMAECAASGGASVSPVSISQFFPRAAVAAAADRSSSFHSGRQQHVSTALTAVREPRDGFLAEIPFSLAEESFILAEVQYNFFLSHIELDVVEGGDHRHRSQESISFGELDFINKGNHPLNTRQWVATQLEPGNYVLRVADDHYGNHFPRSYMGEPCFPLKFQFQVFSLASPQTRPTVIGVHPDPSLPVKYGQDLVVLLRLSTPPSAAGESASSETIRRSAYLFGETGVTLYPTHFANLDSYDDAYEPEDAQSDAHSTGVVWSFLFAADKLQRLGNSAKFVLEFTSKRGGQPYTFGILRSGVHTPAGSTFSSSDGADYITEVKFTFLSPGTLRENAPWTGGLASFALQPAASLAPAPGRATPAVAQVSASAGTIHRESSAQKAEAPPPKSEVLRELDRASAPSTVSPPGARGPLIPPKVSRSELLVEDDEADEPTKPGRVAPWDRAPRVTEGTRRAKRKDPYATHDTSVSEWEKPDREDDLGCGPDMRWNEETAECEELDDDLDGPATLLLVFVSLIGVTGLLLLSRYVLRRRAKGAARHPYRLARANSAGSDSFDFLPGQNALGSPAGLSDRDDDV